MAETVKCPACEHAFENYSGLGALLTCPQCDQAFAAPRFAAGYVPPSYIPDKKSAGVAAALSAVLFGVGQIYNGSIGKAIGFWVGGFIAFIIFPLLFILVWLYGIFDAYSEAEAINAAERKRYGL